MLLRYERLPNFCFKCGIIGHVKIECQSEDQNSVVDGENKTLYGIWMKATGSFKRHYFQNCGGRNVYHDHYSNSFTKGGSDENMPKSVLALNGVNVEEDKGKHKELMGDSSMIEAPNIVENVVALKSANINVLIKASDAVNDSGCLSENLGSQNIDNINDQSLVINANVESAVFLHAC
ncbi:hypothetical protein EZV62_000113 [Acer yangbiense]|uniref:CCHC-type domain-containing protein n=1 Tax=Acer yangbiense TaxID=1000413 RepID=A0A5C7IRT8_9ROSI|nr:hypothetical protein EZV62_000113 [Acer yangbiense]